MDEEIAVRIDALTIGIELPTTCKTDAMYDMYMNPAAAGVCIDGQMGGTARPGPGTPRHGTTRHGTPGHEKTFVPCRAAQRAGLEAQARH